MIVKRTFPAIAIIITLVLASCGNETSSTSQAVLRNLAGTYTSPSLGPIPAALQVSIDTQGKVSVGVVHQWNTPFGTFDVAQGIDIAQAPRNAAREKLLIVRIDGVTRAVAVLSDGRLADVTIEEDGRYYKKIHFAQQPNGDFLLEVESVAASPSATVSPLPSATPISATTITRANTPQSPPSGAGIISTNCPSFAAVTLAPNGRIYQDPPPTKPYTCFFIVPQGLSGNLTRTWHGVSAELWLESTRIAGGDNTTKVTLIPGRTYKVIGLYDNGGFSLEV